ncbi:MAG: hypothetical protein DRN15_10315 [Thermoprotei archaeon]|nr:MAG: hypothetical protein DRN15_10315 [Thermoprotei archaeon]
MISMVILPADWSTRKEAVIREVKRKSIHIIPGVLGPPIVLTIGRWSALIALFFLILYVLEEIRLRLGLDIRIPVASNTFEIMAREEEKAKGRFTGTVYFWSCTLLLLSLPIFDLKIALAAIMISSLGDAMAAIVGKAVGRTNIPYCKRRTMEGSIAMFLTSLLTTTPFVGVELAFIGALIGTLAETIPIHYTYDEISVPMASAMAMQLYLLMYVKV